MMKTSQKMVVILMLMVAAAATRSPAEAQGRAGARPGPSLKPAIRQFTDPKTGLEVRVTQVDSGTVAIEIGDKTVAIRKQFGQAGVVTSLRTKDDEVSLAIAGGSMTLVGRTGTIHASPSNPETFERLSTTLRASGAVQSAVRLLGRLSLNADSPVGHSLILTRAFFQMIAGDHSGMDELGQWLQGAARRIRLTQVAYMDEGPGWCWDQYAREAISIADEYAACLNGLHWYQFIAREECYTVYFLRAEGAFWWWVRCVGLNQVP